MNASYSILPAHLLRRMWTPVSSDANSFSFGSRMRRDELRAGQHTANRNSTNNPSHLDTPGVQQRKWTGIDHGRDERRLKHSSGWWSEWLYDELKKRLWVLSEHDRDDRRERIVYGSNLASVPGTLDSGRTETSNVAWGWFSAASRTLIGPGADARSSVSKKKWHCLSKKVLVNWTIITKAKFRRPINTIKTFIYDW